MYTGNLPRPARFTKPDCTIVETHSPLLNSNSLTHGCGQSEVSTCLCTCHNEASLALESTHHHKIATPDVMLLCRPTETVCSIHCDERHIYYGNWPAGSGQEILENFIRLINDSSADGQVSWWKGRSVCNAQWPLGKSVGMAWNPHIVSDWASCCGFLHTVLQCATERGSLCGTRHPAVSDNLSRRQAACPRACTIVCLPDRLTVSLLYGFPGSLSSVSVISLHLFIQTRGRGTG